MPESTRLDHGSEVVPGPPIVQDAPAASRFEISSNGELRGIAQYRLLGQQMAFIHTTIEGRYQGHGLATTLIASALANARSRGLSVLPYCPYVNAYLVQHPEEADLVPAVRRTEFGL